MEYYQFVYEDVDDYKEQMKSEIRKTIDKSDLKDSIPDKFFEKIGEEEPHLAVLFLTDLQYLVLRYEGQIDSLPLWEQFLKNLPKNTVDKIIWHSNVLKSSRQYESLWLKVVEILEAF